MSSSPTACAILILATLVSLTAGCRSSRSEEGRIQIVRAGQAYYAAELELTPEDERMIEAHARFAAGIIEELESSPDTALQHFREALALDPDNEGLAIDVARKLIERRRLEDARQILERASRRAEASGLVWGWLGTVHSLQGNPTAAIAANEEAIRRMPHNIVAYQNLTRVYLEAGQPTEALAVLEEAARQPDADSTFLIVLADTLSLVQAIQDPAVGDLNPRILALLDRAASLNPERPAEVLRLADMYQIFGQQEKALPLYQKLLETAPDLPGLRERLATVYLRSDDREKAMEQLRMLTLSQPTNPLPHYYLGLLALEAREFDQAVQAFNQVLVLWPNNQTIYLDLALAHLSHRRPEEALRILDQARERFRPTFQLEYYTAAACSDLQQYERAIRHFTAAEVIAGATNPGLLTSLFYFQSGVACERATRIEDAAVQFQKAIELQPDFADALNYLGYMWAERGENLDRAHELIERAVALEPENAAYIDSLAWVLYQLGRYEEALPHQLRAIELTEEPDATLMEHLGDIYLRLGQTEKATEAWKQSLAIESKPELESKLAEALKSATPPPESNESSPAP